MSGPSACGRTTLSGTSGAALRSRVELTWFQTSREAEMAEQRSPAAASQDNLANQDDLTKQIERLRSDVAQITKTLGDLTKGQVTELRARGRAAAEDLAGSARRVEHDAEDYIRDRPLQALAIAAGLGVLVGWLTRR
jgi:ElaB/YqjD/DUF883 family membrane-anchored ribosome-binding protein